MERYHRREFGVVPPARYKQGQKKNAFHTLGHFSVFVFHDYETNKYIIPYIHFL